MQGDVAETIFGIVKVMPRNKQERVLDFVNDLQRDDSGLADLIRGIGKKGSEISDDVWDELPTDGSVNHDHYLYGSEKRPE